MSIMNLSSSRMIQHSLPRRLLHNHSGVVSIALFFVFCCVVFSLITSNFLTGTNWLNIIRQSAPLLIVATAMTLVITTGGIDLSVGSTLAAARPDALRTGAFRLRGHVHGDHPLAAAGAAENGCITNCPLAGS